MDELGIVHRQAGSFFGDRRRVLAQFFLPGDESRCRRLIDRIASQPMDRVGAQLTEVIAAFGGRHRNFEAVLMRHFEQAAQWLLPHAFLTLEHKLLIGSYFTKEYSIEAAAMFNPSIAPHPDQSGATEESLRYVLSLRATGEGHISSVVFSSGTADQRGCVFPDPPSAMAVGPRVVRIEQTGMSIEFDEGSALNERVIFPISDDERNGIEDLRLACFTDDDGRSIWYGTYTAYDGRAIRSKLLRTTDFRFFILQPLFGAAVRNKGLALFPRKIDGRYAMISRLDGENLFFMSSSQLDRWESAAPIQEPEQPWEFVQLGNCGSPIETDEGWLLLSHGVGPMRTYVMSAYLLDRRNPARVIGRLPRPLLAPNQEERDGYVPNVVYSCGSMKYGDHLIIPYAMSDTAYGFASLELDKLLSSFV